ncbi:acetyl-CoA carboxylase biotin carboxylase subunit [Arenicellales bacterium nBUS_48]
MFEKLLIANRGEIACRVIRSARKMGISTVAVFSEADRDALHVSMADEAVFIGPAPSSQSYLLIDRITEACKATGAQAVHPGYGFLSENQLLASALEAQGVIFVGPPSNAIEIMGDKIASKKLADSSGVSTIPGINCVIKDDKEAVGYAEQIGYPVMLKASAGGGGKGMRIAHNADECRDGFNRAASEAQSSFGDDRIFIEKFISEPRHIELQVLADQFGNTIHLNERECSIQRRHQKVLEEAPSSFVDEALRQAMGEQAVALARAVGYVSAGTVEFIVDAKRNFYFLEMNTRLQVEHPVTEKITGVDLVEWMLRIAAGEKLSLKQQDVQINGWSMESRIYAEDPIRGFLPSSGRVKRFRPPEASEEVRVDTGLFEGAEVSLHYDPMVAKLVTFGRDRNSAADVMSLALDRFEIDGIESNISFLASLVANKRFREGSITTAFIDEEYPDGFSGVSESDDAQNRSLAVLAVIHEIWTRLESSVEVSERSIRYLHLNNKQLRIEVEERSGHWSVTLDGVVVTVSIKSAPFNRRVDFDVDGIEGSLQLLKTGAEYQVFHAGSQIRALLLEPSSAGLFSLMPEKAQPDRSHLVLSPMPGLLVSLNVDTGSDIKAGDEIAIIEAMKMENIIRAQRDGKIASIEASVGEALEVDQCIARLEKVVSD